MIQVVKRDGETAEFCLKKITEAIKKAFRATGNEFNDEILELLSLRVTADFQDEGWKHFCGGDPGQRGACAGADRLHGCSKGLYSLQEAAGEDPQHEQRSAEL